jgi:GntR family transcriptional regulator / MocR family aminotransferase
MAVRLASFFRRVLSVLRYGIGFQVIIPVIRESSNVGTNRTISLNIDRESIDPAYRQVYQQLRERILAGQLPAGVQLPTSRQLSQEAGIARVTVVQAYKQLEAEGFVESRAGAGTFVNLELKLDPLSTAKPDQASKEIDHTLTNWGLRALSMGEPEGSLLNGSGRPEIDFGFGRSFAQLFPYDIWRRLLGRYLSTDDAMLSRYGSPAGFFPLRQAIADYLVRVRGVRCTAEQVVIVSGAQQALDILARLILRSGDEVLVETPGYQDAYTLFKLHDARLTGIAVDHQGLPVADIPANCRPRLIFVTPSHQFPRGGTMPLTRRLALLAWARAHGAIIVEDDYDGDLRYDGHSLSALQGLDDSGGVVYLGTFSKVLFPALRLGYVVLPGTDKNIALGQAFIRAKNLVDRGAPTLTQAAVADFIAEGHFERHLRHLRRLYGERRQVLTTALDHYLGPKVAYSPVPAGLHVMLLLESGLDENWLVYQAASVGVRIYGGAVHYLEQPAPPSILLGFSGLNESDIREGVRRLASIWP